MRTLERLSHLSRIADILAFFGITDDAGVLRDHGGAVLRLWAHDVATIDEMRPVPAEPERLERYATALRRAYETFALPARRGARGWRVIDGGAGGGGEARPGALASRR